jgi:hypothetical protein
MADNIDNGEGEMKRDLHRRGLAVSFVALVSGPAAAATCDGVKAMKLDGGTITSAEAVTPPLTIKGQMYFPSTTVTAPFCRVKATLTPTPDSDIKVEVWLPPAEAWNGKFEGVGNGGLGGPISYVAMTPGLMRGYAVAATDTGHDGSAPAGSFALGHPEKVIDYGYRSTHLMGLAGKAVAAAYYGRAAKYAYFQGCSQGGQEAMMEAERFPADYDGIVAGDPDLHQTRHEVGAHLWVLTTLYAKPGSAIPPAKATLIGNVVNRACDALDGVTDGVLEDPRRCTFDPGVLQCKGADAPDCLTQEQADAVRKLWAGPASAAGVGYYPGFERGGEATLWPNWMAGSGPETSGHAFLGLPFFKYFLFKDPNWDFRSFDYKSGPAEADRQFAAVLNADDPDLTAFRDRGGKLIHYHGFSDPDIPPGVSIKYRESVEKKLGGSRADIDKFYRLFMVPGMGHCAGGPGPNMFDMLPPIEDWVEKGMAPARIVATKYADDKPDHVKLRTRPLCPYPTVARYGGSGGTDDAANFTCGAEP